MVFAKARSVARTCSFNMTLLCASAAAANTTDMESSRCIIASHVTLGSHVNILFIGDIFASPGRRIVADHLQDIVQTNRIDLAVANAENAAGGFGITPVIAE